MLAAAEAGIWILYLVVAIVLGWATGAVARNKGYTFAGFFVLGFFLGLIGLIIALVIPRKATAP